MVHDLNEDAPLKSAINKPIDNSPFSAPPIEVQKAEVKHVLEESIKEQVLEPVNLPIAPEVSIVKEPKATSVDTFTESRQQVSMTFEFEIEEPIIESSVLEVSDTADLNSEFVEEPTFEKSEIIQESIELIEEDSETIFQLDNEIPEELEALDSSEDKAAFSIDVSPILSEEPTPIPFTAEDSVPDSDKIVHTLSFEEDEVEDLIAFDPTAGIEVEPILSMSVSTKPLQAPLQEKDELAPIVVETAVMEEALVETLVEESTVVDLKQVIVSEEQPSITLSSHSDTFQEQIERAQKRKERLQKFNYRFRNNAVIDKAESEPAYKRQGVQLDDVLHSTDEPLSRMSLSTNDSGDIELKSRNSFLHDNVD